MSRSTIIVGALALVAGILIGHFATRPNTDEGAFSEESGLAEAPTLTYAKGVEIAVIDFEESTLAEIADYLRHRSNTGIHVGDGPPPFRLNFIVNDPNGSAHPVTLRLRSMRLDHLCERIAQLSGTGVTFDEDAIVFTGK